MIRKDDRVSPRLIALIAIATLAFLGNAEASSGPTCSSPPTVAAQIPVAITSWGDPDLQGVWSGTDLIGIPVDRDPALGTRNVLTEEEFQALKARLLQGASSKNIEATNFGVEPELAALTSHQASLVVDPADGRRPPPTPAAEARPPPRNSFVPGSFNSVSDFGTYDRCIAFSTVPAAWPVNGLEIVQGPGFVAIRTEVIHEARIVPLDGKPRLGATIKSYMGDSRGRWDGRTLVVETTNLNGSTNLQGNAGGRPTDQITVTEKFTRIDQNTLWYEATIDDPGTWTRSWTIAFPRNRQANGALYEYACHEGNYGLANILRVSRAAELGAMQ